MSEVKKNRFCDSTPVCEFLDYTDYKYTCTLADKEVKEERVGLTDWVLPLYDCKYRGLD